MLIVAASVATIAMIGGAVALISFAGAPQPADEAANVCRYSPADVDRPGVAEHLRADLPTPGPTPTIKPTTPAPPAPSPEDEPEVPGAEPPVEPTTEPVTEEPNGRPDPPGQTNKPDKPKP